MVKRLDQGWATTLAGKFHYQGMLAHTPCFSAFPCPLPAIGVVPEAKQGRTESCTEKGDRLNCKK